MKEYKLSVIMSVYNNEEYLAQSIESILNQTYVDFEFIIINDGSNDKSLAIMQLYAQQDERIKIISRKNKGLIYSLNEAINMAHGQYIARMDGDDESLLMRFELQMQVLIQKPEIDLIFTDSVLMDNCGKELCKTYRFNSSDKIIASLPNLNYIVHPSVIIKKSAILSCGLYDYKYKGIEDVMLWEKMKLKKKVFYYLPIVLIKYRINPKSVRGIDLNKYNLTLAKEMIVNRCIMKMFIYFKDLTYTECMYLIFMAMIPHRLLRVYSKYTNRKKIEKVINNFNTNMRIFNEK